MERLALLLIMVGRVDSAAQCISDLAGKRSSGPSVLQRGVGLGRMELGQQSLDMRLEPAGGEKDPPAPGWNPYRPPYTGGDWGRPIQFSTTTTTLRTADPTWVQNYEAYQRQVGLNDALTEPISTPHQAMCSYGTSVDIASVVRTPCDDIGLLHQKLNQSVPAGYTPLDAAMQIIEQMKNQPSNKFFANPNWEKELTIAKDAFGLIDAGHSSLLPSGALGRMMKAEGIEKWSDFKSTVQGWSEGSTKNTAKLAKAFAAGAIDVVANFAGPFGAGLSLVGAVLSFWETDTLDAQLQSLAEKLLKEVGAMIDRKAAETKTKEIQGWLSGFVSEMGFVTQTVQLMAKEKMAEAGMLQFVFLNALQSDLATTRYQWMPFRDAKGTWQGGDLCAAPHRAIDHLTHPCVALRNTLAFTVPTLATMHLTLIDMMISAVATHANIVTALKKKFFTLVVEYYNYFNKFKMSYCTVGTNQWKESDSNEDNYIIVCAKNRDAFIRKWSQWNTANPPSVRFGFHTMCCRGTRQKFIMNNPCGCANPNSPWDGRDAGLFQLDGVANATVQEMQDFDPTKLADHQRDWPQLLEEERSKQEQDKPEVELGLFQTEQQRPASKLEEELRSLCGDHLCLHEDTTPDQHRALKAFSRRIMKEQGLI